MSKEERIPLSNVQAINDLINDQFKVIFDHEQHIQEMMDKHISPLKNDLTKIRKNLAADTALDSKDIKDFYSIYKRQELAKLMDDDEDRGRVADAQKVLFGALHKGQTLDCFDVLDEAYTPQSVANDQAEIAAEKAAE